MAIDITGAKQLEQQLRQAQRMETIGRLAGGVAHDFNNLLTVIRGFCDLLMEDLKIAEGGLGRLEHFSRAADRALALTHQLLEFRRQQILQPRVSQLRELIEESTKMLQRRIGEHIGMKFLNAPCLGKVKADPGQIERAILNLAVNARDAMPTGATLTIERGAGPRSKCTCRGWIRRRRRGMWVARLRKTAKAETKQYWWWRTMKASES